MIWILGCIAVFISAAALVFALDTKAKLLDQEKAEEKTEEEILAEACNTIAAYCGKQTEDGKCIFNMNETNEMCNCKLIRVAPEDWDEIDKRGFK